VIAVDTNLLVRLLTNDDPDALHLASSAKANRFATFDRDFVKKASKLGSMEVFKP
jgi:predicted nucleic acid-binding protein